MTVAPTPEDVRSALQQVIDPEVGVDIVSLGLVYGVEVNAGTVTVTFTLTTPGCPLRTVMTNGVSATVYALPGVEHVNANLVWEPRWHPGMIEKGALER
ncbi:MAG TPA: metal-sulfur cluster assembly factor [Longimicrobiales bacterium]|nr:metal-sulfur cluster assembly factor [Longimicrobiales bacterium]